jgi:hypothetical protein
MKNISELFPDDFQELVRMEESFGHTMKFEKKEPLSLPDFIKKANQVEKPCMSL